MGHLYILYLGKCLFTFIAHFLNLTVFLILSFRNSPNILYLYPIAGMQFSNIFSHSVGCLLTNCVYDKHANSIIIAIQTGFTDRIPKLEKHNESIQAEMDRRKEEKNA